MAIILKIGSDKYQEFTKGSISLKYATVGSTFTLTGLFDHENALHRRLFRPLSFQQVKLISSETNELLLTGTVLSVAFSKKSAEQLATISGYSKTGVLVDSKIPLVSYPLEFNGLTLRQIATKLIDPFGLSLSVINDNGISDEVIEEVTADTNQTIERFLVQIAAQRNLIISHDNLGRLVITRANTRVRSIATYREAIPATSISLRVNGQQMHSEFGIMKQPDILGDNASEDVVENSLIGSFRPTTRTQSIGTDNTAEDVGKNLRANELRGIRVIIGSDRWEWLNSFNRNKPEVVNPNNIVDVISPSNFIARRTAFFVEQTLLIFDSEKEISTLTCVPPEVFNNEDPKQYFS